MSGFDHNTQAAGTVIQYRLFRALTNIADQFNARTSRPVRALATSELWPTHNIY